MRPQIQNRALEIHLLRLEGHTLKEIGLLFGVTRQRIEQLHKQYLKENKLNWQKPRKQDFLTPQESHDTIIAGLQLLFTEF